MDSLPFLIQTYIFEFIDTQDSAIAFIKTIYRILSNLASSESNPTEEISAESVLKRLFVEVKPSNEDEVEPSSEVEVESSSEFDEDSSSEFDEEPNSEVDEETSSEVEVEPSSEVDEKFESITQIQTVLEKYFKCFPFVYPGQLPSYTHIPQGSGLLYTSYNEKSYDESVERSLYLMFCCLCYKSEIGRITLDKIEESASSELLSFFRTYPKPVEFVTPKMCESWRNVVLGAKYDEVAYKNEGINLCSGVLNILQIMYKLTGIPEETEYSSFAAISEYTRKQENLDSKFNIELEYFVEKLFEYKIAQEWTEVTVFCTVLSKSTREDGIDDIYGEITIQNNKDCCTYSCDCDKKHRLRDFGWGITFKISPKGITTTFIESTKALSDEDKSTLLNIQNIHAAKNTFMNHLIVQHINNIYCSFNSSYNDKYKKSLIIKVAACGPDDLNSIFLCGYIRNENYKLVLMHYLLNKSEEDKLALSTEHPLVRTTSNILGSVFLEIFYNRFCFLSLILYPKDQKALYPNIKLTEEVCKKEIKWSYDPLEMLVHEEEEKLCVSHRLWSREVCLEISPEVMSFNVKDSSSQLPTKIFDNIFEDNNIDSFKPIMNLIRKKHGSDESLKSINILAFVFFVLACAKKSDQPDLIVDLLYFYRDSRDYDRNSNFIEKVMPHSNYSNRDAEKDSLSKWVSICSEHAETVNNFFNKEVASKRYDKFIIEKEQDFFKALIKEKQKQEKAINS